MLGSRERILNRGETEQAPVSEKDWKGDSGAWEAGEEAGVRVCGRGQGLRGGCGTEGLRQSTSGGRRVGPGTARLWAGGEEGDGTYASQLVIGGVRGDWRTLP